MVLLISAGCGAAKTPARVQQADVVLRGGDVRTMDAVHPHATAIAIRGETIAAVGSDAEIAAWIGPGTQVVELAGHTVTPGLTDAHAHLYGLGLYLESVSVRGAASAEAAAAAVREAAAGRSAGEWLTGRGWDQNKWAGQQFPTRQVLDVAVPEQPVVLRRIDGHALWANSRAIAAAGVTKATQDPDGGKIVRDRAGEPTGVFVDNAMGLVEAEIPAPPAEVIERRIVSAAHAAVAAGLTGVHEMGIGDETIAVYRRLAERGELPLRVYAFRAGDAAHPDALRTLHPGPPVGLFTLRGVKLYADGALGSRGARLYEPYDDDPGNRGLWVTEPALLAHLVDAAVDGGWQVAVHAIGDAGIGSVLDAYEAAEAKHPGEHRLRVEHVQVIAPRDVDRMVATHAIASMQPTHATSDMPWAEARVGTQRILGAYAWRTMLDRGIPFAAGSDFPVEEVSPLRGLYAAVTRQDAAGMPAGGWYPAQRMTLDEAIAAFTRGAAYAAFAEQQLGTIAPGRAADLTVFDRVLAADRSLLETRIAATYVAGKRVYDAGAH